MGKNVGQIIIIVTQMKPEKPKNNWLIPAT